MAVVAKTADWIWIDKVVDVVELEVRLVACGVEDAEEPKLLVGVTIMLLSRELEV